MLFLSSVLRPLRESELLRSLAALGWTLVFQAASTHPFPGLAPGYHEPARLGVDRWLALVALRARGVLPSLVVDAGSALTVDCLTAEGRHEGGWIVPGLALAQRALFQGTDGVRGEWGWCWDAPQAPARHTAAAVAQGLLQQAMALHFRGGSAGHDTVGASSNDCPHRRRRGSASAGTAAAPAWPCGQARTWTGTRGASRPGRDPLRPPLGLPTLPPAPP